VQASDNTGQETIGRLDFIGQKIKIERTEIPSGAPPEFVKEISGAGKLSLDFHFRAGGTQLDRKSLADLDSLVELLANPAYQQRRVLVLGFSDNSGNASRNRALSMDRAKAVAEQLQMRGITPSLVNGYGKDVPIASNHNEVGREKNRRVEVWLR
jgi:phosphate transport system substrate-binding protein